MFNLSTATKEGIIEIKSRLRSTGVEDVSQNKDTNQKKPEQISQIKLTQWTQNVIFSSQAIVITHSGEENPVR